MKPRLALVEDAPDIRFFLRAVLGDAYEIDEFESGEAAVAEMPASPPHVILMDITLPGIDGVETLRRLRTHPTIAATPVIALTGHASSGDEERFRAAGFDGYFEKPIVDDEPLVRMIERILASPARIP